jgi:YHS domain-containing protein
MIQDVWRKVLVRNEKTGEELNFCSDSCKEEFDKKSCK